jgi:hypothetical protein
MDLVIDYIRDAGNLDKERIVFKTECNTQLGQYLIAETYETDDAKFSSKIENIFWFPDLELKVGDRVVLYTKSGERNISSNEDGTKIYFFYWNLSKSHLKGEKPCVVLLNASWKAYIISKDS